MRVKRYIVDSMPDALQRIRTDLGKDAVILNTKEVRTGGFLGMFSKKKIEVIAATDSSASAPKQDAKLAMRQVTEAAAAIGRKGATAVLDEPMPYVPDVIATPEATKPIMPPVYRESYRVTSPAETQPVRTVQSEMASKQPDSQSMRNSAVKETKPQTSTAVSGRDDEALFHEIRQMKAMMSKLAISGAAASEASVDPLIQALVERLRGQEIAEDVIREMSEAIQAGAAESEESLTSEYVRDAARTWLMQLVVRDSGGSLQQTTRIAHFVGPTGVGKTTTIAKMAAEQVIKHKRKVGFITSDTYRIAAVEQLKTYANILNVPLEVVSSPLDLRKAFERLESCELILMDTAGRNYRNELYVSELNALLQSSGHHETFLVLSLTSKYSDMRAITANFAKYGIEKVLFTKMDETDTYGPIVNLLHDFPLKLSYVTHGQNVPEDIRLAEGSKIVDLILGADEHE